MEGKREAGGQAQDSKEYCASDKDIVEVVRTEYVYTRPPPWSDVLATIHIITPTYSRPVQKAELTRLANTFLHVPNLHWILVEDAQRRTPLVTRLLRETGLNYTHLNVETPKNYKLRGDTRDPRIPRGTMQRNLALRWLRETFNANSSQAGIVYFADDDNSYSLELFEEVRVAVHSCLFQAFLTNSWREKDAAHLQEFTLWGVATTPFRGFQDARYVTGSVCERCYDGVLSLP